MNIDKAIRKQKKSYKIFMLLMVFIFFLLPIVFILNRKFYVFYMFYLIVLESLIFLTIIITINNEFLKFEYDGYRLKMNMGVRNVKLNIICNKVVLVHVENYVVKNSKSVDFRIIFLFTAKSRNNRIIPVNREFLKKHPCLAHQYNKLKILRPNAKFYYTIVKNGRLNKYLFLDTVYKSCVYAYFTKETIEKIKYYRENSENYNLYKKNITT